MSEIEYPDSLFTNKAEYDLTYGADGFLYAQHKISGIFFVYIGAEWQDLDTVLSIVQSVDENNINFDVDNGDFFSDDC